MAKHATANPGMFSIRPLSNHASVTFEPEFIEPKVKRYYSIRLSNMTWTESEPFKEDPSKLIMNNWITSGNCLMSCDKTVLNLDSCTIETVVLDADIDTVEHILNMIVPPNVHMTLPWLSMNH